MSPAPFPVVLGGGAGSRLWPMPRQLLPNRYLPFVAKRIKPQEYVRPVDRLSRRPAAVRSDR